jgi:hypothetical protein
MVSLCDRLFAGGGSQFAVSAVRSLVDFGKATGVHPVSETPKALIYKYHPKLLRSRKAAALLLGRYWFAVKYAGLLGAPLSLCTSAKFRQTFQIRVDKMKSTVTVKYDTEVHIGTLTRNAPCTHCRFPAVASLLQLTFVLVCSG